MSVMYHNSVIMNDIDIGKWRNTGKSVKNGAKSRILPGMGKIAVTAGSAEGAPVAMIHPTHCYPKSGLHNQLQVIRLCNLLRGRDHGETLSPRVCLRHYPRLRRCIPSGEYSEFSILSAPRYITHLLILAVVMWLAASCRHNAAAGDAGADDSVAELPLPALPEGLTQPEERAAYLLAHFWDDMDFNDCRLSLDTAFMEQNFANFAALFDYADSAAMAHGASVLLDKAATSGEAFDFLNAIIDKYLYDPESPMYNEEYYTHFLRALLAGNRLDDAGRERARYRLETAMKNSRGTRAADFRYVMRGGGEGMLSEFCRDHEMTLLLFYDPDCENCKAMIERLRHTAFPPGTAILAIDTEDNRPQWERTCASLPAGWTVGYALDPILDNETYVLPAMPVIYLLDSGAMVLAKDPRLP